MSKVLELENVASPDSLRKVIAAHFPVAKIAELNIAAFNAGYEIFKNSPVPD